MNPNLGLARLLQPRSNMATNMLFAITFVVFALLADTAIDQQRGEFAQASGAQESFGKGPFGVATMPTLGLHALVRPWF